MAGAFSIGEVISDTFASIADRARPLLAATIIYAVVPACWAWSVRTGNLPIPSEWRSFASTLVMLPFGAIFATFVARQVLSEASRSAESWQESLQRLPGLVFPIFALQLLMVISLTLATLLLIVPGLMLSTAWSVAIPVRAAEPVSIWTALSRSADLTRDNRLRILGLYVIYFVAALVLSFVSNMFATLGTGLAAAGEGSVYFVSLTVSSLLDGALRLITVAGGCAIYVALKKVKGGGVEARLAEIFA